MNGPLQGVKVLDLSRVLAGPWATQLLADYGADVVKIERPGSGDDTRHWGPPWLHDSNGDDTSESAYFLSTNRNKRSVTVNLAHPDGQAVVADLARGSDVLLENFKVGTLRRFGLHEEAMREINRRLIYCSISAFGQSGSRSGEAGYDAMMQAAGGLMSITGDAASDGGSPQKVGVAISDIMTGMYAVTAILAALVQRQSSGAGQYIDLSLYDCQVGWLANQSMNYLIGGNAPERFGNAHPNIAPYQSFESSDGQFMLAVGNDSQFAACADCIGLPQLANDPRFRNNETRVKNRADLIAAMQEKIKGNTTGYWLKELSARNVPAGPINDLTQIFSGDYASERGLVHELPHPLSGQVPTVANPVKFSDAEIQYRCAPPTLGQHTVEVLQGDLGYSDERIQSLIGCGAI